MANSCEPTYGQDPAANRREVMLLGNDGHFAAGPIGADQDP
jgi:hypothetical protein